MGEPVVVPIASKEELLSASKEELSFASQDESKQFASSEESQIKGVIPVVVVQMEFAFISLVIKSIPPIIIPMEQNATEE